MAGRFLTNQRIGVSFDRLGVSLLTFAESSFNIPIDNTHICQMNDWVEGDHGDYARALTLFAAFTGRSLKISRAGKRARPAG